MRPTTRAPAAAAGVMLIATGLSACGKAAPTLNKAGEQLASDGNLLLRESHIMWPPINNPQTARNDIRCGNSKAKRAFVASANFEPNTSPEADVLVNRGVIIGYMKDLSYEPNVDVSQPSGNAERIVVMTKKEPKITFRVRIKVSVPNFRINAETACLDS